MKKNHAALAAASVLLLFSAGCQTASRGGGGASASDVAVTAETPADGAVDDTATEMAGASMETAAKTSAAETTKPVAREAANAGGACVAPRVVLAGGPPPVPNKVASMAGGVAENAGRNVTRNVGVGAANQVVGRIPGIGGVIGVAATQTAGKEVIKTAEDVRGTWSATDGRPDCGCKLEFSRPGMVMTKNVVAAEGCASSTLAAASRWAVVDTGFAKQDLVLYKADGKSVLARLDRKGVDYFQGSADGVTLTVWR